MAKLNIVSIADHINRTHSSFAGHPIFFGSANIKTFRELLNMDIYFQRTPSAISCNFDAITKGGRRSTITISKEEGGSEESGLLYSVSELFE